MKSKILFILHTPPPVHGAAMVGSYIKGSELINNNFDTKYIRLGTTSSFEERGKINFTKILRFIRLICTSLVTTFKFRPDIIYMSLSSNGIGFYKDAVIVLLLKLMGAKLVYHFQNKGVKTRQEKIFDNWLYKRVFNGSDVILLSQYLYSDVEKYVSKVRVHYCPNGIPDLLGGEGRENNVRKKGPVLILFLSNLLETKGVYELLEACKYLKEKDLEFRCIIAGGEVDITGLDLKHKIYEMDLESEVTYEGKKYNEEKVKIFMNSDIFAFPTYYPNETFGLVNLEAMQAKLPVVSTPEGGIPDVVEDGETGFLVPKKNSKALAEKLEILIKNPELRKRMGEAGRQRYETKFTVGKFEKRLSNILQDITAVTC